MKVDRAEQAHFRIDEHERRLSGVDEAAKAIPHLVEGGVSALRASMKGEFMELLQQIMQTQAKDVSTDLQVVERLDRLIETNQRVAECLEKVAQALTAPCTRESTINLPSGPVRMTVHERKQ